MIILKFLVICLKVKKNSKQKVLISLNRSSKLFKYPQVQ